MVETARSGPDDSGGEQTRHYDSRESEHEDIEEIAL